MRTLVWLRSDIRFDDNPSLKYAFETSDEVICIYLFSKNQFKAHNDSNIKINFICENLKILGKELDKLNVPLVIENSNGFKFDPDILLSFCKNNKIEAICCNNLFGIDENNRDMALKSKLEKSEINFIPFHDQVLFEPGFLKTGEGKPFSVFTPFKRRWVENFDIEQLDIDYEYKLKNKTPIKSNYSEFKFDIDDFDCVYKWKSGEISARKALDEFLHNKVMKYAENRNDPILEGTSRISPYLAIGAISPKRCILEALKKNKFELVSGNKGVTKWIDEIVWREFYKNIMHSFPHVSMGKPFQKYTDNIKWRFNKSEYESWKKGETGFPIIDAAMIQLREEGWMHNRLRMIVAMFFTKNMLHDWRLGEKFFMENLIDGDFSSNNGGWQWSSSTGTDAAPYFRIFNPITQSQNFDKDGLFIKKFIPKLKDLNNKDIHNPPIKVRKYLGYPEPILDLRLSRERAIEAFKSAKN